ncbi:hypothetical protein EAX61_07930 [Dokdonia sinensis]|uniref:Uncharacterized protein n=1 Tax=Dokdonia sinensis TaxID=2479847 RepID=A0A3M0G3K7_9FLAO|nr:hypothetical protein [Dokdonia sinensis]RMB59504.1 hypothetical protein EAX61_07930 [Dokdonia sinensis]
MGQMIGIPFIFWLIVEMADFGSERQFFAIIGILGIVLLFSKWYSKRTVKIASLILMLLPIASRFFEVPLEKFDYHGFQIPLSIYIGLSIILILVPANKLNAQ